MASVQCLRHQVAHYRNSAEALDKQNKQLRKTILNLQQLTQTTTALQQRIKQLEAELCQMKKRNSRT